jgi:hypothetical protein
MSYETDFVAWTKEQAALLRKKQPEAIDWDHLAEEIESVGNRDKREMEGRARLLIAHLLKWRYQPQLQCRSWRATIDVQREELLAILEDSPSLKLRLIDRLPHLYARAKLEAETETGIDMPEQNPFRLDEILGTMDQ